MAKVSLSVSKHLINIHFWLITLKLMGWWFLKTICRKNCVKLKPYVKIKIMLPAIVSSFPVFLVLFRSMVSEHGWTSWYELLFQVHNNSKTSNFITSWTSQEGTTKTPNSLEIMTIRQRNFFRLLPTLIKIPAILLSQRYNKRRKM